MAAASSGRYTLNSILQKEQFRIKLSPGYYCFSLHNLIIMAFCYVAIESFLFSMSLFLLLSMFSYRYVFSMTKDGNQYDVFCLKYLKKLALQIRNKTRIREKILNIHQVGKK